MKKSSEKYTIHVYNVNPEIAIHLLLALFVGHSHFTLVKNGALKLQLVEVYYVCFPFKFAT